MANQLNYETLRRATSPGGASVMTWVTELRPAAGEHSAVAPARYVVGKQGTYSFERRFIEGEPMWTVLLDSKQSQLNRFEDAIAQAIRDEHPLLSQTPRIRVSYGEKDYWCIELPHRFSDGHIRSGSVAGTPTTKNDVYVAARNATPADARPLLELSPGSLVFGSWDSTRKSHQARYRSCVVGEIIGVLAHQSESFPDPSQRAGARSDQVSPGVRVSGEDLRELYAEQAHELSDKNKAELEKDIKKAKSGLVSASRLGLGSIPPTLEAPGLVACRRIVRSQVLTFSTLRQLRFGGGAEGDVACRSLLAAYAINGLVRSNAELVLRANCDLVEAAPTEVTLDRRQGEFEQLEPLTIEDADALLNEAITAARSTAKIRWEGQELHVEGNPLIAQGIVADAEDES